MWGCIGARTLVKGNRRGGERVCASKEDGRLRSKGGAGWPLGNAPKNWIGTLRHVVLGTRAADMAFVQSTC